MHELRFQDLEADPLGELQRLYQGLSLSGWNEIEPKIRAQMPEHAQYRKNRFELDEATRERYYQRLKFALDLYGYDDRRGTTSADAR